MSARENILTGRIRVYGFGFRVSGLGIRFRAEEGRLFRLFGALCVTNLGGFRVSGFSSLGFFEALDVRCSLTYTFACMPLEAGFGTDIGGGF